jgi:excisionase family DNA binding protein
MARRTSVPADRFWPLLLTDLEAAMYLGCGRDRMRQLMKSGEVPTVRLGRLHKVNRLALERWALSLNRNRP